MSKVHTGHVNGDTQTRKHIGGQTFCHAEMHSLSNVAGYLVRQTYARGELLGDRPVIQRFEGATTYAEAQDLKRSIKVVEADKIVAWAVVSAIYADGCESQPF